MGTRPISFPSFLSLFPFPALARSHLALQEKLLLAFAVYAFAGDQRLPGSFSRDEWISFLKTSLVVEVSMIKSREMDENVRFFLQLFFFYRSVSNLAFDRGLATS